MPDEKEQVPSEQAEDKPVVTIEELQEQLAAANKAFELQKTEIAGLNRTVSKETNARRTLQEANMSAEEKAQAEIAEMQKELAATFRDNTMLKHEIPEELAGLITGSNKTDIEASAKILSTYRLNIQSEIAQENETLKKELVELKLKTTSTGPPVVGKVDTSAMTLAEATKKALANR